MLGDGQRLELQMSKFPQKYAFWEGMIHGSTLITHTGEVGYLGQITSSEKANINEAIEEYKAKVRLALQQGFRPTFMPVLNSPQTKSRVVTAAFWEGEESDEYIGGEDSFCQWLTFCIQCGTTLEELKNIITSVQKTLKNSSAIDEFDDLVRKTNWVLKLYEEAIDGKANRFIWGETEYFGSKLWHQDRSFMALSGDIGILDIIDGVPEHPEDEKDKLKKEVRKKERLKGNLAIESFKLTTCNGCEIRIKTRDGGYLGAGSHLSANAAIQAMRMGITLSP